MRVVKKIAFQMDPFEKLDPSKDSSLVLAYEARMRGYEVFHYLPETLSLREGKVTAYGCRFTVDEKGLNIQKESTQKLDLGDFDAVMIRQDPPFDMAYITSTYLLEHLKGKTLVLNNPQAIRKNPEKILMTYFKDLIPPTIITRNEQDIKDFANDVGDVVLKPLYGYGGMGVVRLQKQDPNLGSLLELFAEIDNLPLIAQQYLPDVEKGDKRIFLMNGEFVAAMNRVPQVGNFRSNMRVGGAAEVYTMTKRDHEICEAIGPILKEEGLFFAGIDVIGSYLTEINVTSPTGIKAINKLNNIQAEKIYWDMLEKTYW